MTVLSSQVVPISQVALKPDSTVLAAKNLYPSRGVSSLKSVLLDTEYSKYKANYHGTFGAYS